MLTRHFHVLTQPHNNRFFFVCVCLFPLVFLPTRLPKQPLSPPPPNQAQSTEQCFMNIEQIEQISCQLGLGRAKNKGNFAGMTWCGACVCNAASLFSAHSPKLELASFSTNHRVQDSRNRDAMCHSLPLICAVGPVPTHDHTCIRHALSRSRFVCVLCVVCGWCACCLGCLSHALSLLGMH